MLIDTTEETRVCKNTIIYVIFLDLNSPINKALTEILKLAPKQLSIDESAILNTWLLCFGWGNLMKGIQRGAIPLVRQTVFVKILKEHHLLPLYASVSTLQISNCHLMRKKGDNNNQQ